MKKTNAVVIAIVGFVIFIIAIVLILIGTASKYAQRVSPQIRQASNVANQITTAGGGINNTLANLVNNAATKQQISGAGATSGSNVANLAQGAGVIDIGVVNIDSPILAPINLSLSPNGKTTVTGAVTDTVITFILPSGPTQYQVTVVNSAASGNRGGFSIEAATGITITGATSVGPGTQVIFTATSPTSWQSSIPTNATI